MSAIVTASPRTVNKVPGLPPEAVIFGRSGAMRAIRTIVEKVARTNVPVLIQGEGGTGKEILARLIHANSLNSAGPFVKVNCAAIPGTLMESELFGYEKGAFTGAYAAKPGQFEIAGTGTMFLDGIAELDPALQAKLLHVLQDGYYSRIGGQGERRLDGRVISATNRDLNQAIAAGRFRVDLLYRINVIQIHMPPLRERREDIPLLLNYFLSHCSERFQKEVPPFPPELVRLFQQKDWPGNIRELETQVTRYVILGPEEAFSPETWRTRRMSLSIPVSEDGTIPLKRIARQTVREMERELILRALQENRWNRKKTAQALAISFRALLYKMREAGIQHRRTHDADENRIPGPAAAS